jgi:integrase
MVSRVFKWARAKRLIEVNPALDIPMPLKRVPTRDRVLDDDEIIAFWSGCERISWPFGPLFKVLLLTGQRLREVARMSWSEINLDERTWRLPAARTKNGRQHEVALSDLAMEILTGLPRFVDCDFVFASPRNPGKPVAGFSSPSDKSSIT